MGLPDTGRYFIALDLGQKVLSALWQAQEEMRVADAPDIRWTRPEAMHLTLKFLGGSVPRSAAEGAVDDQAEGKTHKQKEALRAVHRSLAAKASVLSRTALLRKATS